MSLTFTLNAEPHEPTDTCTHCHCYYHGVDEAGETYRECYECGHAFPSLRAIRRDYITEARPLGLLVWLIAFFTPASRIDFCPHCTHDF